jgi:hypothetical protein
LPVDLLAGTSKIIKLTLILLLIGGALTVYYFYNPGETSFFLPCPFKFLTGYDCPGCGSQRAIHQMLHGNVVAAFQLNPMLLLSIPLIIYGLGIKLWNYISEYKKTAWLFYYKPFIYGYFGLVTLFWILRNTSIYPWN